MVFLMAFFGWAQAASLTGVGTVEEGTLLPGLPGTVEFVLLEGEQVFDGLLDKADTDGGRLLSLQRSEGSPWVATLQAESGSREVVLEVLTEDARKVALSFPVAHGERTGQMRVPSRVDGVAGQSQTMGIALKSSAPLRSEDVQLWFSEGSLGGLEGEPGGLRVNWTPGDARQPRMALMAVRDLRFPREQPLWVPIRLRARPPVTVRTEPGTDLTIELGSRRYGPVKSGEDGSVTARVDVYPGEQTATAFLSDGLGNTQRTTITVAPAPDPVLGLFVDGDLAPGRVTPRIHIKAMNGSGQKWRGAPPECRAAGGDALRVASTGESTWVALLSDLATKAAFDIRVDCRLGPIERAVHVPVRRSVAQRVVLQVYPRVLSSDFPVAQVQAFLEDATGERIGSSGVTLQADSGTLVLADAETGVVRADYRGNSELAEDRLTASFNRPAGTGGVWQIETGWRLKGGQLEFAARLTNRFGNPLAGQAVQIALGDAEFRGLTNERGWVVGVLPDIDSVSLLKVTAGNVVRNRLVVDGTETWVEPTLPDLVDSQELVFQAGRVSQVFIAVEPRVLFGEPGATATVEVRLLDRGGRTVIGEPVEVKASEGVVDLPKVLADGSFMARYRPPGGMVLGEILLSAEGQDGQFAASTTLKIVPRPQRFGIGVGAGYLVGVGGLGGPSFHLDVESKLKWLDGLFQLRGGVLSWQNRATVFDEARGKEIDISLNNIGLGAHVLVRQEREARSTWVGLGAMIAPYSQTAQFDNMPLVSGWGVHKPGIVLTGGGALRALSGELSAELRWVGMSGRQSQYGFEGSVGGMAILLGYRVIL